MAGWYQRAKPLSPTEGGQKDLDSRERMALFFNLSSVYHIYRNMKVNTRQNSLDLKAVAPGVVGIRNRESGA